VLPLILLSYVRGALWTWVQATRDVTIVLLLVTVGNVTVGAQLYGLWFDGNFAQGAAASVLLAAVTSLVTFAVVRLDPGFRRALD
jgi:ABC-type Fe3+ transport system permease subunit